MSMSPTDDLRLSVVVPTLNEAPCIETVLVGLLSQAGIDELLVVDGGSTDGTIDIVDAMGVRLHRQESRGLGHGLHEAFALASGDVLCVVDADGSHDWREIPRMRAMIVEGYDYVLASRYVGPFRFRGPHRWPWSTSEDDSWLHEWGNLGFVALCRALPGLPLSDVMMGFQMVRREALEAIGLVEQGQCFDAELKIKLHRAGYRLGEISAIEPKRIGGEAKLTVWKDGPDVLRVILKEWVRGGFRRIPPR
jgi:glycosyltransferase involved in cell wall biosynthesis